MEKKVLLKDVATLLNGRAYKQDELLDSGKYPVLRVGNFFSNRRWFYSDLELEDDKYCDNGDLLFAWSASFGPKIWDGGKVIYHYHIWKILTTPQIDKKYFYYYLENAADRIKENGHGIAMIHTTKGEMEQMELQLPEMEQQLQIAAILDKVSELIFLREKQLTKLDQLVKARFIELFGDVIHNSKSWQMRVFADITSSRLGKMLDAKQQTGKCSYPYLANFNVKWFRFNLENLNVMDFDEDDRIEFELKDGDLLVCEGGEIGRCAVWHNETQPCFFQKALHRVRCDRLTIHPDYLAWWFKYNCDHNGFAAIAGAKATIAHLPGAKLKQLQVAVPPLELQEQFADFVEQTNKSKLTIQSSLDKLEILKKSLMQKYFG